MNLNKDLKKIGMITNTFGIKGTVKLLISDEFVLNEDSPWKNKLLFYQDELGIIQPLKISSLKQTQHNLLLIDFETITDITQAEKFKNKTVYSLIEDELFIEKVNYLTYKLIFNFQNKQYELPIIEVMNNGKYSLVKIEFDKKKIWVPLVDEYLDKINDNKKIIVIKNFERLV